MTSGEGGGGDVGILKVGTDRGGDLAVAACRPENGAFR